MADPFKAYTTRSGQSISALMQKYGEESSAALAAQLYQEAQGIIAQSVPLVPVDTGALRASHYVDPPAWENGRTRLTVTFGYGGVAARINPKTGESTAGYAIFVHENLEAHHKTGIAKFLEIPFDAARPGMGARIATGMRQMLQGGGPGAQPAETVTDATQEPAYLSAVKKVEGA